MVYTCIDKDWTRICDQTQTIRPELYNLCLSSPNHALFTQFFCWLLLKKLSILEKFKSLNSLFQYRYVTPCIGDINIWLNLRVPVNIIYVYFCLHTNYNSVAAITILLLLRTYMQQVNTVTKWRYLIRVKSTDSLCKINKTKGKSHQQFALSIIY